MKERNFQGMLKKQWSKENFLCVGLDNRYGKVFDINREIIDSTNNLVCAYKFNIASYLNYGGDDDFGEVLYKTINYIRGLNSDILIIFDAKFAEAKKEMNSVYAKWAFDYLGVDAVTICPYAGKDAFEPFLERADKGIFVVCHTSNSDAPEFQHLKISFDHYSLKDIDDLVGVKRGNGFKISMRLYEIVAYRVANFWNDWGNCGLVAAATYPEEIANIREISGNDMPILIPGIGSQGGDFKKSVKAAANEKREGFLINVNASLSRECEGLKNLINECRK